MKPAPPPVTFRDAIKAAFEGDARALRLHNNIYAADMLNRGFTSRRLYRLPIDPAWRALYEQERDIQLQARGWVVGL